MNIILFDDQHCGHLRPFTLTRPAAGIRCGILTLAEKWKLRLGAEVSYLCDAYLAVKFPARLEEDNFFINGRCMADDAICETIRSMKHGEALKNGDELLAYRGTTLSDAAQASVVTDASGVRMLTRIHQIFSRNASEIQNDFTILTGGRSSLPLPEGNMVTGKHPLFIEEGAVVSASVFNTNDGPVYIGRNAEVMEGCLVRGPFALGEGAILKMGAKIYGATTIGPHCRAGGEINNSVMFAYSNKGHDGFLGNAVLGEWCNLGADSNNSNLKNNYEEVKLWNYPLERFEKTGLQFCGLFMGDHSKCGINTMFNTGTVVGVSSNIFGSGFPRNFIPSFSWGGAQGMETYATAKAFQTAERVMSRRNVPFTDLDKQIMQHIYELESKYRNN